VRESVIHPVLPALALRLVCNADVACSQIVDLLMPELQRKDIFLEDYPEVDQHVGATNKVGSTARA